MANRHLARSLAMQTLFEWDFNKGKVDPSSSGGRGGVDISEILERNKKEFAPGMEDDYFAKKILDIFFKHKDEIDDILEKAAPEWPIAQIAPVDRNVLRLGLAELLFGDRTQVPPKVAINEAIELAKTFGGNSSGKFVNGVLGTVYKEIGEPGKDDMGRKFGLEDLEKLPKEELGGAIVFRKDENKIFVALVHDVFGYWTLSKGHLEKDENIEEGTKREITEELGLKDIKITKKIGDNEYIASDPEMGPTRRHVNYFLIESLDKEIKLESSGGLDDARWFPADGVSELKIYDDVRPIIEKGIKEII